MFYAQLGFQKKLSLGFTAISLVSMVVCGAFSYVFTSSLVRDLTITSLSDKIRGVESAILVSKADNFERQKKLVDSWSHKVIDQLSIHKENPQTVTAENQVTHEKSQIQVPALYLNGKKLENHGFVDMLADQTGEAITLFVRMDSGFYRVSTTVKKADGSRNVGTFVPASSPVYESLLKGERYIGRAQVAGSWYITAYEPILQGGQVVGSFFLGAPETSYSRIKDYLKSQKILQTGYFFIMDSAGQLILDPANEGQNVLATKDLDGKELFKQILKEKTGNIEYRWLDSATQKPQAKLALFRYFPEMDWYVAASVNLEEAQAPILKLKWILFLIAAGMTSFMTLSTIIFGKYVAAKLVMVSNGLKDSGEQVSQSSTELTTVSNTLAAATSQQAANLEQTMSAIEEIRSMVNKNLESTSLTENLSKQMSSAAEEGQKILSNLVEKVRTIAVTNDQIGRAHV